MKPVALLTLSAFILPSPCFAQNADRVASAVEKSLNSAPYKNVQVSVRGSVVTLTGTVDLYASREAAENQIGRTPGVVAIQNEIRVAAPAIPDDELRAKVEESMAVSLHGHNIPHSLSINAHNGVVSLDGYVSNPQLAHDLFEAVARTTGVREIVNGIQLSPPNPAPGPVGGIAPWPSVPPPNTGSGVTSQ